MQSRHGPLVPGLPAAQGRTRPEVALGSHAQLQGHSRLGARKVTSPFLPLSLKMGCRAQLSPPGCASLWGSLSLTELLFSNAVLSCPYPCLPPMLGGKNPHYQPHRGRRHQAHFLSGIEDGTGAMRVEIKEKMCSA